MELLYNGEVNALPRHDRLLNKKFSSNYESPPLVMLFTDVS